jgi:hypothetical protein
MTKAKGSFELASWDEDTYEEMDNGAKLTRASVTQTFSGGAEGDGAAQWLMAYRPDGTAHFVGLQRITGTIDDRKGTVVLETIGDFDGKVATWTATVVPGSGTGDLEGLTGGGTFEAPMGSTASFDLDLD